MSQRSAKRRCARPEMSATGTDVPEIGWAGAADTVKSSYGHLVKDLLVHLLTLLPKYSLNEKLARCLPSMGHFLPH